MMTRTYRNARSRAECRIPFSLKVKEDKEMPYQRVHLT